jgi:hypothetical protein
MSTILKEKAAIIETGCTINIKGKSFTSGGSWLAQRKDNGKYEGYLYASPKTSEVTSWDGSLRIPARFGRVFQSNWVNNKRQYCWFTYEGINFIGINYSIDWREDIFVKQIS